MVNVLVTLAACGFVTRADLRAWELDPAPCQAGGGDADADGVCDDVDACAGHDDDDDLDADGTPDGCDDDRDGDGLDAAQEAAAGTDPDAADTDRDGLDDGEELELGTDPLLPDSDDDTVADGAEVHREPPTDPLDADSDDDGLSDGDDAEPDPLDPDVDDDGSGDGDELAAGTDPTDPDSDGDGLQDGFEPSVGADPTLADTDEDGLDDGDELARGTDAADADTDDDTLPDGDEVAAGTDPTATDTDGDTLSDADPRDPDPTALDADGDGLDDGAEVLVHGSDPALADTDGDAVLDPDELALGTGVGDPDSDADGLLDGEDLALADPLDADSDDDGVTDGAEVAEGGAPLDPDTDGDGVCDGHRRDPEGDGLVPPDPCRSVWFVAADATGGATGRSWADAVRHPGDVDAVAPDEVWVARGEYVQRAPDEPLGVAGADVAWFGGFAGEGDPGDRAPFDPWVADPAAATVFTGVPAATAPLVVVSGPRARLDGFALRDGSAGGLVQAADAPDLVIGDARVEGCRSAASGGGLQLAAAVTVLRAHVVGNHSDLDGGGVWADVDLVVEDSVVADNTADRDGGGVYGLVDGLGHLTGVVLERNTAAGFGGGARLRANDLRLRDVEVLDNAAADGGGLWLDTAQLDQVEVAGNTAMHRAGGLWLDHGTATDVELHDNTAESGGGFAGGALLGSRCRVHHNTATDLGGGVYNGSIEGVDVDHNLAPRGGGLGTDDTLSGDLRVWHGSVQANTATSSGGGLYAGRHSSIVDLVDVDVTANVAPTGAGLSVDDGALRAEQTTFADNVGAEAVQVTASGQASAVTNSVFWNPGSAAEVTWTPPTLSHTAFPGTPPAGTSMVSLSSDPFVRSPHPAVPDLTRYHLAHAGLDGVLADSPPVDAGLDPTPSQWDLERRSTRSDGAVDLPPVDLGRHYADLVEDCENGTDDDGNLLADCTDVACVDDAACADTCPGGVLAGPLPAQVAGSTVGLPDHYAPTCTSLQASAPEATWAFTAPAAGTYVFDTLGATFDTALSVLDGCDGAVLACNDDVVAGTFQSEVSLHLAAGQTVVVVVDGFYSNSGDYVLAVR